MLVERCYNELIGLAVSHNSRLAFQVLGDFLMTYGAKMTEDVKKVILKIPRWNDDRRQLKVKQDKTERKKYLLDFREKILNYKDGKQVKVPIELVTNVADRILKQEWEKNKKLIHNIESYIQRTPILE